MALLPDEPAVAEWRAITVADLVGLLTDSAPAAPGRPRIVGIDGRSASGKSTLARRLADELPGAVVVHTDDLAWWEPYFEWGHLLLAVLSSLHRGESVTLRPPAWDEHGREGAIEVPAETPWVIVEGVGANQRDSQHLLDARIWVQSDFDEAERRGQERDIASGENGDREESISFWHEWMGHETASLANERPWDLADIVVAGTDVILLTSGQIAVGQITSDQQ